jgi:hypothetical protein
LKKKLSGTKAENSGVKNEWSGVRDSNPCKSAWKADAQPLGQPRFDHDRLYHPLHDMPEHIQTNGMHKNAQKT